MSFLSLFNPRGSHSVYNTLSAAVAFTKPDGATHFAFQPQTQAVYYTLDGTTPTSSNGALYVAANDSEVVPCGDDVTVIKIIEATASAKVNYIWLMSQGI